MNIIDEWESKFNPLAHPTGFFDVEEVLGAIAFLEKGVLRVIAF